MSTTLAEITLETVIRKWITDVEIAIFAIKKLNPALPGFAYLHGGVLSDIPKDITLKELENEVLPEIKQRLGL